LEGWTLIGLAWRPGDQAVPTVADLDYHYAECTHAAGPPVCWCRKPLPGLVLEAAKEHDIDIAGSIILGDAAADRTMAARLGARYVRLADFR
jgi:histidinol phosphatase-like enzyme